MPEIINSLFGRNRNDGPNYRENVASSATAGTQSDGADVAVIGETVDTNAIEVEPTGTVEPTDDAEATEDVADSAETAPGADGVVESTEADATGDHPVDSDSEDSDDADELDDADDQADDDQADDDEPVADEATTETAAEDSDEAVTDNDLTEEIAAEDDGSAEDIEPVAVEADEAPVDAEPVAVETDADDVDQTEPVVVPVTAETRAAADTRGSVTVGDGVVAKVVNIVVGKIDGVHSLDDDGISIEVADDIATIKVSLAVEYGHPIKALAEQIRVGVIEAVEEFLGLDVAAVDVHVSDIHPPTAA
jgi:uncharacterized alkaline shock family protein YloU